MTPLQLILLVAFLAVARTQKDGEADGKPPAIDKVTPAATVNGKPPAIDKVTPAATVNGKSPVTDNGKPAATENGKPPATADGKSPATENGKPPATADEKPPATIAKKQAECECLGPTCNGETKVECADDEDVCFNVRQDLTLNADGLQVNGDVKGCAKSNNSFNGSFTIDLEHGVQLNIASKLCDTTECDASFHDPWIRNVANGKECPQCYKSGQSSCTPNGTVSCRGDMINCTTVSGVIIEGDHRVQFAGQGCATPSVCEMATRKSPVLFPSELFTIQFDKVTCSGSPASLRLMVPTLGGFNLSSQVAFFFPCLLGLLTVKTFSS